MRRESGRCFSVNVGGTFNVLNTARELRVRRVIVASSREVYGEPLELPVRENSPLLPKNAYGASKAAAEMYCSWFAATGLEVTALRPFECVRPRRSGPRHPPLHRACTSGRLADHLRRRADRRLHLGRPGCRRVPPRSFRQACSGERERRERNRHDHPRNRQARPGKLRLRGATRPFACARSRGVEIRCRHQPGDAGTRAHSPARSVVRTAASLTLLKSTPGTTQRCKRAREAPARYLPGSSTLRLASFGSNAAGACRKLLPISTNDGNPARTASACGNTPSIAPSDIPNAHVAPTSAHTSRCGHIDERSVAARPSAFAVNS